MCKDELLELLGRMCAPHEPDVCRSSGTESACQSRQADTVSGKPDVDELRDAASRTGEEASPTSK